MTSPIKFRVILRDFYDDLTNLRPHQFKFILYLKDSVRLSCLYLLSVYIVRFATACLYLTYSAHGHPYGAVCIHCEVCNRLFVPPTTAHGHPYGDVCIHAIITLVCPP